MTAPRLTILILLYIVIAVSVLWLKDSRHVLATVVYIQPDPPGLGCEGSSVNAILVDTSWNVYQRCVQAKVGERVRIER